ncbi:MAG: UDP-N-acetylmuramate--L-alanine ligase [Candidatus Roizmanbacteria bacterium]|nr:UDP-N-acetylmuramate--L-alanine ligase [Candidatus Roizmanbacteria bacterium]
MKTTIHAAHFVGIQGVGMSALALIYKDKGINVNGSDAGEEFDTFQELRNRGITVYSEFSPSHVMGDVVIYGGAHNGEKNIEVMYAKSKGIPTVSFAQALGNLSSEKITLAICGCHGKTTTSALSAYVLDSVLSQVSYAVGAAHFSDKPAGKWTENSALFVVEADEYVVDPQTDSRPKFSLLSPRYIIATVFDYDHVDMYASVEELRSVYARFFESVPQSGIIFVNADDAVLPKLVSKVKTRVVTYGTSQKADYRTHSITRQNNRTVFSVTIKGGKEYIFTLNLHGKHNAVNATGVIAFCNEYGLDLKKCAQALSLFSGVRRRLELHYDKNDIVVLDDYAHHPAEITATLNAVRTSYKNKKIAVLFQPHTFSRTKHFLSGFIESLSDADYVGVLPIFASKRELLDDKISSEMLVSRAHELRQGNFNYIRNEEAINSWLKTLSKEKLVIVTMGAGDVYTYTNAIKKFFECHE